MALPADGDYNKVPYETNVQVMFYENQENEDYPLHWHTATEIIMPIKHGYDVVLLKKLYTLRENDILIIPTCELHSITVPPSAKNGKRIILMFEPTLLYSLSGLSGILPVLHSLNLLTPEDTPEIYETTYSILLDVYDEYQRADALRNPAIYARIIDLYVAIARYHNNKNLRPLHNLNSENYQDLSDTPKQYANDAKLNIRQQYIARLNAVFVYIDKHISEKLTLKDVAEIAHFSPSHFERIFKEYTNYSFYQYLKRIRIKKAETLLLTPELSITAVALDVGFESITAFNKTFKEIMHCTPSAYKKLYRRQATNNNI
jgi:AraC-like DNA-binding protein